MGQTSRHPRGLLTCCCALIVGLALPVGAVELRYPEPDVARTLQVSTPDGRRLGEGTLTQWTEGERLHVLLTYRFEDGRRVEEQAVFRQQPELVQESWTWMEQRGERTTRQYAIDFESGKATGIQRTGKQERRYSETLKVEPGRTFAGVGMVLAAKNLLPELRQGREVALHALAAIPRPRRVKVTLSQKGSERLVREGRILTADRIVVHPEIGVAGLVVKAPDIELYFAGAEPPVMLGGEAPLLEPGDPVVRTEVLPRQRAPAARQGPREGGR
ncbi:MAG: hypothetical protein L0Y66_09310 [Myxococcaceae bacterium]|nr:hypothetical protein [Myxococcaceae bacterium]